MSKCRSCGQDFIWATTVNGRAIPLNVERSITGNLDLRNGTAHYVTPDANASPLRYTSHFATCSGAGQHRKPRSAP